MQAVYRTKSATHARDRTAVLIREIETLRWWYFFGPQSYGTLGLPTQQ